MFHRLPWTNKIPRPSYNVRCLLFGLETLQHRRTTAQITFMHKLLIGDFDAPDILNFICFSTPSRGLTNRELLRSPFRSTGFGANDPLLKMIDVYNRLGLSADFNQFVSQLRQHIQDSSRAIL